MIEEFCYEDFKHSDDKMVLILLKNYIEFVEKRNLSMINGLLKNSFDLKIIQVMVQLKLVLLVKK